MITVDSEFQALIPPLTDNEYQALEESLKAEGCRDALVVWQGTVIDGHNRLELCKKHNIEYKTTEVQYIDNRNDAKLWIIRNQLARRNLTTYQRAELALKLKPVIAEKARERQGTRTDIQQNSVESSTTQNELAKAAGVSHDTIHKAEVIAEEATEEVKEKLRVGDTSINRVYNELKDKPHVTQNSGNNEWYTPGKFIQAAKKVMGRIDLDPASSETANALIGATKFYTQDNDGLTKKWHGCIWMNPPYEKSLIPRFVNKLIEELPNIEQAVVLVNNATETAWFQQLLNAANIVCFMRGRVKFLNEDGVPANTPLQGQAIMYFGKQEDTFVEAFSSLGQVLIHA